jgi:hypothetical protein
MLMLSWCLGSSFWLDFARTLRLCTPIYASLADSEDDRLCSSPFDGYWDSISPSVDLLS